MAAPAAAVRDAGRVAALCREHGYPAEVQDVLERIVDTVATLGPVSILLHGSTARGELTWWRTGDGTVRVGSDMEMYVVADEPLSATDRGRVEAELSRLAQEVNGGGPGLFHVDVGFTTPDGLRRHPRTFRCWDTRETGRMLLGPDVRELLPALGPGDVDLRQLNEVPVHRLWEMVFRAPASMVRGGADDAAVRAWGYVCARQALDLTTWLLPHFGVLVPTFGRRVDVWAERFAELPLARYFAPESGALLRECLEAKLRFELHRDPREMHAAVLDQFRAGLRLVVGTAPDAGDDALVEAVEAGGAHWHGAAPRRRAYEAVLLLRDRPAPVRGARWWLARKPPLQVAALLRLNAALADVLAGRDADRSMGGAETALARLAYGFEPRPGSAADRFVAARRGYVEHLVRTSRWFAPRRGYLFSIIDS